MSKSFHNSCAVLARYKAENIPNYAYIEQFGDIKSDQLDNAGEFTVIFWNPNDYYDFETMALSLGYIKIHALVLPVFSVV